MLLHRFRDLSFAPKNSAFLMWLFAIPSFFVALAMTLIINMQSACGILMILAIAALFVFWKASSKLSAVFLTSVTLFFLYALTKWPQLEGPFERTWAISLLLALITSHYVLIEIRSYFQQSQSSSNEMLRDRDLWKTRFDTLQDKHREDVTIMEEEIEVARGDSEEMKRHVDSLRSLIEVTQEEAAALAKEKYEGAFTPPEPSPKEMIEEMVSEKKEDEEAISKEEVLKMLDELNHYRTEHYQLQLILEDFRKKLLKPNEPFKWQKWKGDETPVKKKARITMDDLTGNS